MTQPTHDEVIAWIDPRIKRLQEDIVIWEGKKNNGVNADSTIKDFQERLASLLANRAGLERHKERPFNWMTDQVIGMFSEAFPEPPQLPRCVTCRYENFPCPTYTEIYNPIVSVM